MRDVSSKSHTLRTARAVARLNVSPSTIEAIRSGNVPKADPLAVAQVAGIQAAKNTSLVIPYCHQVPLDFVGVEIKLDRSSITISTEVKAVWKTGVEMEALVAASAAALTLYDMLKIIDDSMEIVSVKLLEKTGGKSQVKETGEGLKAAVLVMSDSVSVGKKEDVSGKVLVEKLRGFRVQVSSYSVMPDEASQIERELKKLADKGKVDLILTSGGTLINAVDLCIERGAKKVLAVVAHHDFSGSAPEKLQDSKLEKLFSTNTIALKPEQKFDKLHEISIASLFADELKPFTKD